MPRRIISRIISNSITSRPIIHSCTLAIIGLLLVGLVILPFNIHQVYGYLAEDVNEDGYIDVQDAVIVCNHFGWSGSPGTMRADVNGDGKVDLIDIVKVVAKAGDLGWLAPYHEIGSTRLFTVPNRRLATFGETFNVSVCIQGAISLAGYQFKISYDKTILQLMTATAIPPFSHCESNGQNDINFTGILGRYSYHCFYFPFQGASPATGDFTLLILTFHCIKSGSSSFTLFETLLADSSGEQIPHTSKRGPAMDDLYIKYYGNNNAVFNALLNGDIDLADIGLSQTQILTAFNNSNIRSAISPADTIFQFDFNNNETIPTYPGQSSPMSYQKFRQGVALLVNKTYIVNDICNYSYRIDTPIPRPFSDWWVDWNVSQYDSYGNLLGNYPYEFNSSLAASYFDDAGFYQDEYASNPYYDASFPGSAEHNRTDPATGELMNPLIFYIRSDDARRVAAGELLANSLRKLGIPVNSIEATRPMCIAKVMGDGDYHIYTGGWTAISPIDDALSLYLSSSIDGGVNYLHFNNTVYDEWFEKAISSTNVTFAREAAAKCQEILVQEAPAVWLWSPSSVTAYRDLCGIVNERGNYVDNSWTFLNARNESRNAIRYGLYSQPGSLNIVTDYYLSMYSVGPPSMNCLNRIYDSLLAFSPYDKTPVQGGEVMPWIAQNWEIGTWDSPYEEEKTLTKLTFHLRDGIRWHDGFELNSADVKFTIDYLKNSPYASPDFLYLIGDVNQVITPDPRTVIVYENVSNVWDLYRIGCLPILPKHIFETISDVRGFTPGADEGYFASETLIGSGPWKYASNNSTMLCLEANREYFMETPPNSEIDFRYDWEIGSFVVDGMDATMIGESFGSSGTYGPNVKWQPGCDLNGNGIIDLADESIVEQDFNATWGIAERQALSSIPNACSIYVDAQSTSVLVGQQITARVNLTNLNKLSGYQFKVRYDKTKLDCLNLSVAQIFSGNYSAPKEEINQANGLVWVSMNLLEGTLPIDVDGDKTLATIAFNATKPGGSILDLWDTKLVGYGPPGSTCQSIAHNALDCAIMVGVETQTGNDVTVAPSENAKVTFANVATGGTTTLNITQPPSTEFPSVLCNEIKTTATYTGNVNVQFEYDPTGLTLEEEEHMKIWLWDASSSSWIDITAYVNTTSNVVYGVSPHLSIFGVTSALTLEGDMSSQGEITVGYPETPPAYPPPNVDVLKYYDIKTTKSYNGDITLYIQYDGNAIQPELERFTKLWVWDEPSQSWHDITQSVDTTRNIVTGVTQHMSIFGVTSFKSLPVGLAVVTAQCSKTVVGSQYSVTIDVSLQNYGGTASDFDVILYINSTVFDTRHFFLHPGDTTVLHFPWPVATWAKARYSVSICSRFISWVTVTIAGDANGDFKIEGKDVAILSKAFNTAPGQNLWNPNADINCDGKVDGKDIAVVCKYFNTHYP